MRHLKSGRALGVKPAHRRAMMRNLVTSLLEHEQITTTVARAKEMRTPLEKMITLGKKGDLAARRRALSFIKSKKAMTALFDELPERYSQRPGGYCRILRVGRRRGDGAELALIQLVDAPNDALANAEKPTARRRGGKGRAGQAEAAEQVKAKDKAAKETDKEAKAEVETAEAAPEETVAPEEAAAAEKTQAEPEAGAKDNNKETAQAVPEAAAATEAALSKEDAVTEEEKEDKPKKPRKDSAKKAEASGEEKASAEKTPAKPKKKPAKADEEDKDK